MIPNAQPSVAIVIPCFNHKRFLGGAIESATRQTTAAAEIIVVDDGSTENISDVVSTFGAVELVRQENRGLAAARNAGLRASKADKIIFLDADDRLLPGAIAAGLSCFASHPDAAFVYGGFEEVRGQARTKAFCRVSEHTDLVRCNWIGMIATVMFDRQMLLGEGGFDESLGMTEDWDAYLRLSRRFPFAAHPTLVAEYVKHDSNMSNAMADLKHWIEVVRAKEWERGLDSKGQRAWHDGIELWRETLDRTPKPRKSVIFRALRKAARVAGLGRR
jgi:glycosyltransferase involved in cell wall biosynthesis